MAQTRRLIWLPEAAQDLERLRQFIQANSPAASRRAARRIFEAAKVLQRQPDAGRPLEDPLGFRDLVIPFGAGAYVLRYRLTDVGVVVVRVWHSREDRSS